MSTGHTSPPVVAEQNAATAANSSSPDQTHHHHHHHHQHKPHPSRELPPDIIDLMDDSVPPSLVRHHSGPFDAVTRSAYLPPKQSPLAALKHSTEETLKATPEISIRDSLNKHVPLQNTAVVPPGEHVPGGLPDETLDYKEENLIGDIGRWQGIEYDDDDRRAKGRHSPDRFLTDTPSKNHHHLFHFGKGHHHDEDGSTGAVMNDGMIEMQVPQERDVRVAGTQASSSAIEEAESQKHHGLVDGIKRRLSLKKHHH